MTDPKQPDEPEVVQETDSTGNYVRCAKHRLWFDKSTVCYHCLCEMADSKK